MSAGYALAAAVGEMPSQLLPARSQMAFTLGFHIILAPLGVAFPALMLIANYLGLRRDDPDALRLARALVEGGRGHVRRRRRHRHGALVRVRAALAGRSSSRFGDVFGVAFAIEGIFFFLEAIFIAIYIFGWKRLSPLGALLDRRPDRDLRARRRLLGASRSTPG